MPSTAEAIYGPVLPNNWDAIVTLRSIKSVFSDSQNIWNAKDFHGDEFKAECRGHVDALKFAEKVIQGRIETALIVARVF